jgi:multidrug efflux system outer membrane protein
MKRLPTPKTAVGSIPALALLALLSGCAAIPDMKLPAFEFPLHFHSEPQNTAGTDSVATSDKASLADADWRHIYTDDALQKLIAQALEAGPDALLATARLRESQAVASAVRSATLPQVAGVINTSTTALQPGQNLSSTFVGGLNVSWELDLWGRYANASNAAKSDMMAREASRQAIDASLVANTASLYYQIAALQDSLHVTESAVANQRDVLKLVQRLSAAGVSSAAEVRQQESVVATTAVRVPALRRQISEAENALSLLVGRIPGTVALDVPANLSLPPLPPVGLPSSLLERRPDLRQAVAQLQAANARVGEAKAQFFPSISLTGLFGGVSTVLGDVLTGQAARVASLGPNVLMPLYTGGALQGNEDVALARLDQAVISYRKSVLGALGEVADALKAYSTSAEALALQGERVTASLEVERLAEMRFSAGTTSFVEVLDAQRQLLAAQTDAVQSLLDRRLALVRLYLALGGGWAAP